MSWVRRLNASDRNQELSVSAPVKMKYIHVIMLIYRRCGARWLFYPPAESSHSYNFVWLLRLPRLLPFTVSCFTMVNTQQHSC